MKRSPANSIFDSLLGSAGSSTEPAPTEEGLADENQQLTDEQLAGAKHHQHQAVRGHAHNGEANPYFKIGQVSDKVTLPGDILLGGLFPLHMKGECAHFRPQNAG